MTDNQPKNMNRFYVKNITRFLPNSIPIIIIAAGIIIRAIGFNTSAIRYDEALSLYRASIPFLDFILDHQKYGSLILWELILRCVIIFGKELWIIRFVSLLLGIATMFVSLKIMGELDFSQFQKIITLIIIAFTPGLIWIAQDARPYALIVVLYLLSLLYALQKKWLGLIGSTGLLMFAHSISPAFAISALFIGFIRHQKKWKYYFIIGIVCLLCFLPWEILLIQVRPTPGFSNLFWLEQLSLIEVLNNILLAFSVRQLNLIELNILFAILISSFIFSVINTIKNKKIEAFFFFVPFAIMGVVSIVLKNVIFFRTLIPLIIPYTIWFGSSFLRNPGRAGFLLVSAFWIGISLGGLAGWNPADRGGNIDIIAEEIQSNWQEGDIIYYSTGTVALPFDYYLSGKPSYLQDGPTRASLTPPTLRGFQFKPLEEIDHKRAWVVCTMDTFLPDEHLERIKKYTENGKFIALVKIFATPDIFVYLVEN